MDPNKQCDNTLTADELKLVKLISDILVKDAIKKQQERSKKSSVQILPGEQSHEISLNE